MKRDFTTAEGYSFTVSYANCTGKGYNCDFANEIIVHDLEDFNTVCLKDHVLGVFKNHYRSIKNFIKADALGMDCDNEHSNDPADWVTSQKVKKAFKDVPFYVSYSRNHMKAKNDKSARPRFHVIFLIDPLTDAVVYAALKKRVQVFFPYFDNNALDAARLFFGSTEPRGEFFSGDISFNQFLDVVDGAETEVIPEGQRNATLHGSAVRILKRYGDTSQALDTYIQETEKCVPPLDEVEIDTIWRSAAKFYHGTIAMQEDYICPEDFNYSETFKPGDYSDVGQAEVLARVFERELRFTKATGYLRYNGVYWQESKQRAQAAAQELTTLQLKESRLQKQLTWREVDFTGAADLIAEKGLRKAKEQFSEQQLSAYLIYEGACTYYAFVIKRRESKNISATLKEAEPMLMMDPSQFDSDPFLLNTPDNTIDLRKGMEGIREHRPEDYLTKCTSCSPSMEGMHKWLDSLKLFFRDDEELEKYVQDINGLAAIGRVYVEFMVVAHGSGKNGKSTFWNTISTVLGTYSGKISADTLTVGCRRNMKPELAETKGKRLLIASELEEGTRLNTSTIKQFCSTDEILAEKKYKDPFIFIPSHTLVLYTNHLPKVGATDPGTWRRLVVVPFNATIEGGDDILNYSQHLIEHCGGAILSWIIEGAKRIITKNFKLTQPECVTKAIASYRDDNDWLEHFISERCHIGTNLREKSGNLYTTYRIYCGATGEYARSTADFYSALDLAGYTRRKNKHGSFISGLQLKPFGTDTDDDFLTE